MLWKLLIVGVLLTGTAAAEPLVGTGSDADQVELKVRLSHSDHNVVRTGPGADFAIVGVYKRDAMFIVLAKKNAWFNVRLSESQTGWIHESLCETFQDLSDLEFRPNPKLYSRVGSYAFTTYLGGYTFDRKSNSMSIGGRLGYYVTEFLVAEGNLSYTKIVRPAEIVESLFDLRLEEEIFNMLYYSLNLTAEILPGRRMTPFVTAGAGANIAKGKSEPGYNLGAGAMLYFGKKAAMRWEVRNYRFSSGVADSRRRNNNFEMILGTSFMF